MLPREMFEGHEGGDLLAAAEPFRCSNHQLERQCCQRTDPRMRHHCRVTGRSCSSCRGYKENLQKVRYGLVPQVW